MFRNQSGGVSWSWSRFVTNAVPNNANDCKDDADLSAKQQDDLFRFQLTQPDPRILNEQSFYIAGIVGNFDSRPYRLHPSISSFPYRGLEAPPHSLPESPRFNQEKKSGIEMSTLFTTFAPNLPFPHLSRKELASLT